MTYSDIQNTKYFNIELIFSNKSVTLDGAYVKEFYFIENIFSNVISGKLSFIDKDGITEFGPLVGSQESLKVTFGTDKKRTIYFKIYKLNKVISMSDAIGPGNNLFEIYFCDFAFELLQFFKYSKSWGDSPVLTSTIISQICNNMCGINEYKTFEPSITALSNFYMPWWTPLEAINWLMKRSEGSLSLTPGYLFFPSIDNSSIKFNLCTIELLFKKSVKDEKIYLHDHKNPMYENRILNWCFSGIDKIGINQLRGGQTLGYNFKKKSFLKKKSYYSDSISKFTILGNKTLFPNLSENKDQENGFIDLRGDSSLDMLENIYLSDFVLTYSLQNCLIIDVIGGNINRQIGEMIEILWNSKMSDINKYNKNLSGKYLIKSITHGLIQTPPYYIERMVLIKNGLENPDESNLHRATKQNLGTFNSILGA